MPDLKTNVLRPMFGAALLGAVAGLSACALPPDAPTVLASANGTGADDAYVVSSAAQEDEILRLLRLEIQSQSVRIINGRAYDVLTVLDPETQEARDVWFDISRFFGRL